MKVKIRGARYCAALSGIFFFTKSCATFLGVWRTIALAPLGPAGYPWPHQSCATRPAGQDAPSVPCTSCSSRAEPKGAGEGATAAAKGEGAGSVTYELFFKEASEARRRMQVGAGEGLSEVEARIAVLEKALGGGKGAAGAGVAFGEKGTVRIWVTS